MSEDNVYQDAEIVWVKLRSCWWPGEVCSQQRQPEGLLKNTKRKPYCVVKFFQEESFEYVKNAKMIFPFNCSKKDEFIRKGHALLAKNKYMEQFPAAVSTAERLTRSVTRSSLFFNTRPDSIIKAILTDSPPKSERIRNGRQCEIVDKILKTKPTAITDVNPSSDLSPTYKCTMCDFQSTRQNVMVMHRRSHSGSGPRSQTNNFVNRSIISPTNTKDIPKTFEIIKNNVKESQIHTKNVIDEMTLSKPDQILRTNESHSGTVIKSDTFKTNEVYTKDLAKECSSKENNASVSSVFIRPPPKKQLNFINSNKSENIQKRLLADWIDEDKDDEEENEEVDNNAKQNKPIELSSTINKSYPYGDKFLTPIKVSVESSTNQETNTKILVVHSEQQKPASKIRNIPKKDRRNIVFTDFDQSDDFVQINSQSMKQTNNNSAQNHLKEENEFCGLEKSSLDTPMLPSITALLTEDSCNMKVITEDLSSSKVLPTDPRGKSKTFAGINIELNNRSTQDETKILEAPFVIQSFQVPLLPVLDKGKITDTKTVRDTKLVSKHEYVAKEKIIAESAMYITALEKSDNLKKTVQNVKNDTRSAMKLTNDILSERVKETTTAVEATLEELNIMSSNKAILSTVLPKTSETITTVSLKAEPAIVQPKKAAGKEQTLIEPSKSERISTNPTTIEVSAKGPYSAESTVVEQTIIESTTLEPTIAKPHVAKSTILEVTTIESKTDKKSTVEPTRRVVEELNTVKQSKVEAKSIITNEIMVEKASLDMDPSTLEKTSVQLTKMDPTTIRTTLVEQTISESSTKESTSINTTTEKLTTVEQTAVELTTVELTIEAISEESITVGPTEVELNLTEESAIKLTTEKLFTTELTTPMSNKAEHTEAKSTLVEPHPKKSTLLCTVETRKEDLLLDKLIAVESNPIEKSTIDKHNVPTSSTIDDNSVKPTTVEPTIIESTIIEPAAIEPGTIETTTTAVEIINNKPPNVEIASLGECLVQLNTDKTTDAELTLLKLNLDDKPEKKFIKKVISAKRSSTVDPICTHEINIDQNKEILTSSKLNIVEEKEICLKHIEITKSESLLENQIEDIIMNENQPLVESLQTIDKHNTAQHTAIKVAAATTEISILAPNETEILSSSNNQLKTEGYTDLAETSTHDQSSFFSEIKISVENNENEDKILKENHSNTDAEFSGIKSLDVIPARKNSNLLKVKKTVLRSATRGCKTDTFNCKEIVSTKNTFTKKDKLRDKMLNSLNENQKTDSSLLTSKTDLFEQTLSIQNKEERNCKKSLVTECAEDKLNTNKCKHEIYTQITSEPENIVCNLPILKLKSESTKTDGLASDLKANQIPNITNSKQSSEAKSHVPVYLETGDAKIVSEIKESDAQSSFSKASLSCFDFNEEEDILTSIANFKKTYVSPEKSNNFNLDGRQKKADAKKIELEKKDKQLSADIESLLETTRLPVSLTTSTKSLSINRPLSNEVRGLPIKERGKRIFKSRNRFRVESCSSVATTTTTEVISVSSSSLSCNTKDIPVESSKNIKQTEYTNQQVSITNITSDVEITVEAIKTNEKKAIDDKATSSEEEIIGRIVFSPAEVYAPSNEGPMTESLHPKESFISSCNAEVETTSPPVNVESSKQSMKNDSISINIENQIVSNESEEKSEIKENVLPTFAGKMKGEKEDITTEVTNQEFCNKSCENVNNIEAGVSHKDLRQIHNQEIISLTMDTAIVEQNVENSYNESKLLDQEVNLIEDNSNVYAEENNEHVYDKDNMSVDEDIVKMNESNCESPFEYELVTTEVSTIMDHSTNEDPNLENVKDSSSELLEEVVSCCDDGTFLNEMIIADVIESQSSVPDNENDSFDQTVKYIESEPGLIENPNDESNSCSIDDINAHMYVNEGNDNKRLEPDVELGEAFSDDSSTVISEVEAEFGSPTSMLEEDRVLNRVTCRSETPATIADGKIYKTQKKSNRKIRYNVQTSLKENKLLIQSLQCDTQESISNDIVNELGYDVNKYESEGKECHTSPKPFPVDNVLIEKEVFSHEKNDQIEKHEDLRIRDEKEIVDSNYENTDSSEEEEEEEICSPPIEPLLDEDTEAETIENYSTTTSLSKSDIGQQVDCEVATVNEVAQQEFQPDHPEKSKKGNKISEEFKNTNLVKDGDEFGEDSNGKQSNAYYTVTQKSDTIIKLNKYKEKVNSEKNVKGWTETSVDVRKSELAGEELTAAEALLLIPNQATNIIENSAKLIKRSEESVDSLNEVKSLQSLLTDEEIKEETLDCNESSVTRDLEICTKVDIPKELVRRKRRSHMKVTPRKRVIDENKLEIKQEEAYIETKVAKLTTNIPKETTLHTLKKSEHFEDSFVLKYMKEQLTDELNPFESSRNLTTEAEKITNPVEKQTLEKVHITVDISNPLSSQIATILGTGRTLSTETPLRSGNKKRKMSVEDDIPSFIIKRTCPKTLAEEEEADRDTIAQIQNLCPQVEITRKSSKDDTITSLPTQHPATTKPQIINQQILRTGNNQPLITVTAKCSKSEEGIFDISNMPIVLSNEKIVNDKLHLVITPTSNQQIIKQLQNQHQLLSNIGTSASNFPGNNSSNATKPDIPVRRLSCVRTKRTPSRQQLPEQQISETQNFEQESYQQQTSQQQTSQQQTSQQQEYLHSNSHQQHQHQIQQEHKQLQQQRQNPQEPGQPQNHYQQQLQQFQHHQNQIQQQLQEEQNILMQQQLMLQQQLQLQQLQTQQQLVTNEKASQPNLAEKQIGIDNRGNKYVIIRNPTNTVVMTNSTESYKVQQQRGLITSESCDQSQQKKQRQKKQSPLTVQISTPTKSPLPVIPSLPVTTLQPHVLSINSTQNNQPQQYLKEQQNILTSISGMRAVSTKPKGRGRGRPPKNKTEIVLSPKQTTSSNIKANANGRRSTGRICEAPRQHAGRLQAVTTSSETQQSDIPSTTAYTPSQQQPQSGSYMVNPQYTTMQVGSSQRIRSNNESYQSQTLGLSSQSRTPTATEISIETSEVSGGGYAVPSLPVPGYPQTYLLCELVGNKYKEVFSKPLYLSPDRTRFLEVPDELVTEAHKKLSDCRREPNPNALKLVSDGTPHILQSRLIEINSENMLNQSDPNIQQDKVLIQKQQQLSVEDQASALLCLQEHLNQEQLGTHKQISQEQLVRERLAQDQLVQEQLVQDHLVQEQLAQEQLAQEQLVQDQLVQEQLVQEQLVQEQLVQEQLVQEQFVEEQFVQEQFVQEQFVPEQFVQEQFVQEQFVQEQFVQDQFVQEQFVPEQFVQEQFNLQPQQFSLQLARFETGEVIEDAERGQMMVVTTGTHNLILDDKSFFEFTGEKKIDFYNAEKDTYVLTPQVISNLLHHFALGHITAVPAMNAEMGDHQHEVSIADVIQNADSSTNILEVSLDDSGLYTEEQFINTGEILQIETPEGMQLIGTAAENADLIFHHMTKANTNETNVLLNQAPKMSAVEIPSDKSKRRFETKPSTPATLEDCLNVIGVPIQSPNVPTSLELPASVTNPAIVAKTRTPTPGTITMNEIIATGLCHHPDITSLPSISSNDEELSYEFFQTNTEARGDKDQVNEESVVTDMGEYSVVTSSASFDDPGR